MLLKIRDKASWWMFDDIARIQYGGSKDFRVKMSRGNLCFMQSDEPLAQSDPVQTPGATAGQAEPVGQATHRRGFVSFSPDLLVLEGINHFEDTDEEGALVDMPWAAALSLR